MFAEDEENMTVGKTTFLVLDSVKTAWHSKRPKGIELLHSDFLYRSCLIALQRDESEDNIHVFPGDKSRRMKWRGKKWGFSR